MNITLIAAIGKNNELGKDNKLLWHIPEDLNFFKANTMNKKIIMGINTLNSLPKLLPGRKHIVLTHRNLELDPEILVFHSITELLEYIKSLNEEVMVIGGGQIYKQMIEYANKLIITKIDETKEADTFFPKINNNEWDRELLSEHEYKDIKYKHLIYKKK